jgi:hypothetical protein
MMRKLKDGKYRLYSRKKDEKTGKRRKLGTFENRTRQGSTSARCSISSGIEGVELFAITLVWRSQWRYTLGYGNHPERPLYIQRRPSFSVLQMATSRRISAVEDAFATA